MSAPSERPMVLVISATIASPHRGRTGRSSRDGAKVMSSRLRGQGPAQAGVQLVPPVLPVMAVARLHEAHLGALLVEEAGEHAVLPDQALVDAAADEDTARKSRRIAADLVDQVGDPLEQRVAVFQERPVENEGARLEGESAV